MYCTTFRLLPPPDHRTEESPTALNTPKNINTQKKSRLSANKPQWLVDDGITASPQPRMSKLQMWPFCQNFEISYFRLLYKVFRFSFVCFCFHSSEYRHFTSMTCNLSVLIEVLRVCYALRREHTRLILELKQFRSLKFQSQWWN